MKVLVVALNRSRQPAAVIPYGACVAAQAALDAGHDARLLDLMFARDPAAALLRACRDFGPELLGFSLRNIDNNDMRSPVSYTGEAAQLIAAARGACGARIVLGGAAVAVMPEALLRRTGADWCVTGDGAAAFPRLLAALAQGLDPAGLPGVGSLKEGRYVCAPPDLSGACGTGFFPDFWRWLDLRAYAGQMAAVPLKTKLGCPYGCAYCTYPAGEGREYRLCPPEMAAGAVRRLASRGVRDIEFVDNVFNSPYRHAMELCALLAADGGAGARLHTMELNPAFTDGPLLDMMERAGFAGIGVTAESADDGVLAALGKNYSAAHLELAAAAVARHNIPCMWIFLLGGPGETRESVARTLAFARSRVRPTDTAFFNAGVRIYPGTPLEARARNEGALAPSGDGLLEPQFYLSPGVDKAWLLDAVAGAAAANPNFIDSNSIGLPFLSGLYRLAHLAGVRQPLWRHTRVLRRGLRLLGVRS